MLSASQEADVGGYRSLAAHYGGQYGAIYGSSSMTSAQQVSWATFLFLALCSGYFSFAALLYIL